MSQIVRSSPTNEARTSHRTGRPAALAAIPADEAPNPETELVAVMETTEPGLLPLARMALEQAGIEYAVQNRGIADQIIGRRSSMTVGETETPLVVVVRAEDAGRAGEALRDLAGASTASVPVAAAHPRSPSDSAPARGDGSVDLVDADSGASIGAITEAQLASLDAHLELESSEDDDYYIDEATLAMLEEKGADADLIALLRGALAGRDGVNVRWRRSGSRLES